MVGTYGTRYRGVLGGVIAIAGITLLCTRAPGAGEDVQARQPQPPQSTFAFLPPYFPFKPPPRPPLPPNPPSAVTPTPVPTPPTTPPPTPTPTPTVPPNPPPPPPKPPNGDDEPPSGGEGPTSPPQAPEPSAIITAIVGTGLVGLYGMYKRRRAIMR